MQFFREHATKKPELAALSMNLPRTNLGYFKPHQEEILQQTRWGHFDKLL